jgi:hypothetical protein
MLVDIELLLFWIEPEAVLCSVYVGRLACIIPDTRHANCNTGLSCCVTVSMLSCTPVWILKSFFDIHTWAFASKLRKPSVILTWYCPHIYCYNHYCYYCHNHYRFLLQAVLIPGRQCSVCLPWYDCVWLKRHQTRVWHWLCAVVILWLCTVTCYCSTRTQLGKSISNTTYCYCTLKWSSTCCTCCFQVMNCGQHVLCFSA